MNIDVIIPVYKPTEYLLSILLRLSKQTLKPNRVICINTEKEYWDSFFGDFDIFAKYPFLEIHHIAKEDFDHGATRDYGISLSDTELFLLMTDDAVPSDDKMLENMAKAFDNPKIAMCYARQMPRKGCHAIEKYTRTFNYPATSRTKGIDDLEAMGIKTFFASDVCCMYRRSVYDELGGFVKHTIFNEDMIFARKAIEASYLIRYEATARIEHSHNYTGWQYLKRNFDLGVSQADHPETFGDVRSEGEGITLVKKTAVYLCKKLMPHLVIKLVYQSGMKYVGFYLGQRYAKLPKRLVLWLTASPAYFSMED